ncbi:hypothetical protein BTA51_06835 [Hahella sp. CCB-MM4]|uniref:hypothetical protein n=1 Tax=Hahella sp. (strain CCB-MM4) TaxID=1926491 RepID=UPI000B9C1F45|nr:hypothetical protein [Hahella sp. CCB-MM4]OZG74691.1 hypothetical protein BTA51_06835 [Hahella sp. CCB-MM4]
MKTKYPRFIFTSVVLVALTACGGGGGGSSDSSRENTLVITSSNATEVANQVTSSELPIDNLRTTSSTSTLNTQLRTLASDSQERSSLATENFACSNSGSGTVTYNASGASSGTVSGQVTLNNCSDDGEYTLDGSLSVSGTYSESGESADLDITGTLTMTELATSKYLKLSSMHFDLSYAGTSMQYSQSYYASGTAIDGSFSVETTEAIQIDGGTFPTSGKVVVHGAEGSSLVIEFDSSGSGVYLSVNGGAAEFYTYEALAASPLD